MIQVTNIVYAISEADAEENNSTQNEIRATLPTELTVKVDNDNDIADAISDKTGWLVESFDIKEK